VIPSLLDLADLRPTALPPALRVPPMAGVFHRAIRPPGSKSLTNRALLLAALAEGESTLTAPLIDADDAQVMLRAIQSLGAKVEITGGAGAQAVLRVIGTGGRWRTDGQRTVTLDLHNAGTATRFLTASALLMPADSDGLVIDGNARMRERPIRELSAALVELGASVEHLGSADCPPIKVKPPARVPEAMPTIEFGKTASSQFISALLLTAPLLPRGLRVTVRGELTSPDYITMTLGLLARVGVASESRATAGGGLSLDVRIEPQRLRAFALEVEPDASGATYFQAAGALIAGATMRIDGLPADAERSLQGDTRFTSVLSAAGAACAGDDGHQLITGPATLLPLDLDLSRMPDTAMTAAVLACFASPTPANPGAVSTLRGLRTLRVKETDRLAALQTELSKLGCEVEILTTRQDESLRITPASDLLESPLCAAATRGTPAEVRFDTYDDHRMAMSLALIGLRARRTVIINDPACVRKTYPTFWSDLRSIYG
jgi:3-phosphoshikimate 1-carboxyvinyltransferase